MKTTVLITLIIFFTSFSNVSGCQCLDYDKETIKALFENATYIIIGKPISNINFDPKVEQLLNLDSMGSDVLIRIDSVLKGDIQKDEKLFIPQFSGSCTQTFHFGKNYLIFGTAINKFRKGKYADKTSKRQIPPPPPPYVIKGEMELYADEQIIKFLNKQISKFTTATTDLCSTINGNSEIFYKIMEQFKNK